MDEKYRQWRQRIIKKFIFRLQAHLDSLIKAEQNLKCELGAITADIYSIEKKIFNNDVRILKYKSDLIELMEIGSSLEDIIIQNYTVECIEKLQKTEKVNLIVKQEEERKVKKELLKAVTDKKIMEKYKKKSMKLYYQELNSIFYKQLDDVINTSAVRRMIGGDT